MSHSPTYSKGGYKGDYIGTTTGLIKGDTRSLVNGSYDEALVPPVIASSKYGFPNTSC